MNEGGSTALQDNEARLRELEGRADKLKWEKEAVSNEIDKLKNDISKQQVSIGHSFLIKLIVVQVVLRSNVFSTIFEIV